MKATALTDRARGHWNSLTSRLLAPGWGADRPSQLRAWPWETILIRSALVILVALPILLVAGTMAIMFGTMMGSGTDTLNGDTGGTLADMAALFSDPSG
jgi:hypothetical protein